MRNRVVRFLALSLILVLASCGLQNHNDGSHGLRTKNIVIVVMDGARYSETWGDPTHKIVPNMEKMAKSGVIFTEFFNMGKTNTIPGHTAITTGVYQDIENTGKEYPENPSIFQYLIKNKKIDPSKAWVITSKDKLQVLSNCGNPEWENKYAPYNSCGISGIGSGYREDRQTLDEFFNVMESYRPELVLINFKEPDSSGHANNWESYLKNISTIDSYCSEIWRTIQNNEHYKNKTALFVTNDHGRHLNSVADGFVSHGCECEGCRRIFLLAIGPDFKHDYEDTDSHEIIDIPATVAFILNFEMPTGKGRVFKEILKE